MDELASLQEDGEKRSNAVLVVIHVGQRSLIHFIHTIILCHLIVVGIRTVLEHLHIDVEIVIVEIHIEVTINNVIAYHFHIEIRVHN